MNKVTIVCLLLLVMSSCKKRTIYHSYHPIPTIGWHRNDTLHYTLTTPIIATTPLTHFQIGIRHTDSYQYKNLWLIINSDTLHIHLADTIGHWYGKGLSELRQLTIPFSLKMTEEDSIKEFRIVHIMQDTLLKGLHDIGIEIQRTND